MASPLPSKKPRFDLVSLTALAVHLTIALTLRIRVWPEVVTPAYLWARGLLFFRDIKTQHVPGSMAIVATLFGTFGVEDWVVRLCAVIWPLAAHAMVLREMRSLPGAVRVGASAFFLAAFFASDGNAVWSTVMMMPLALPVASLLARGRMVAAGLLIGLAILLKQTAAYMLFVATAVLLWKRRPRDAGTLSAAGSLPYFLLLAIFFALGAGPETWRWTFVVPFTVRPEVARFHPPFFQFAMVVVSFVPLAVQAALERPGEHRTSARWLLPVAVGFAAICYPRFDQLQTVAAIPCLAVGAGRLMGRQPVRIRRWAFAFVAAFVLSRGADVATGGDFDGKLTYWNDEPGLDELAARLRRLPRDTPLHALLFANVLPRSGLLPPGRIYVHPLFAWFHPVERIGERVARAAEEPGTVVVRHRTSRLEGEVVGPFVILRR